MSSITAIAAGRTHTNTRGEREYRTVCVCAVCRSERERESRGPWVNIHHTLGKLIHLHAIDRQPTLTGSIIINLTTRYLFWCPNSMRLHALITLGSVFSLSLWLCDAVGRILSSRSVRVHTARLPWDFLIWLPPEPLFRSCAAIRTRFEVITPPSAANKSEQRFRRCFG
jgi:hypothetical protein